MLPPILQRVEEAGHRVFTGADSYGNYLDYDLNIVAVRRAGRDLTDQFDDMLCCVYKVNGQWIGKYWPITTDPGKYYLETASEDFGVEGTAILVPGQYRGAYKLGNHGSTKYLALVQSKPVAVYRDSDKDLEYDHVNMETGMFAINIHASSMNPYTENKSTEVIGNWSGGCQVFKNTQDYREFIYLCQQQITYTGWTSFTYTLLQEEG